MDILITGAKGFVGKNLVVALKRRADAEVFLYDMDSPSGSLEKYLAQADVVYHLAGVNRPEKVEEFDEGNTGFTATMVSILDGMGRKPAMVMSSSTQAALDNPYGVSKKKAEDILRDYGRRTGAPVYIYRLPGIFGKWSRPNYNTVVATFCHNIARGLDIAISDRDKKVELVYIDDVVSEFLSLLDNRREKITHDTYCGVERTFRITLGDLAERIYQFREMRRSLIVPDLSDYFTKCLHATYSSFLEKSDFSYPLEMKTDARGSLFELIKSEHFGQIFVSTTHKGVVRGNHYHDSKVEKFCVIKGEAVIRFRHVLSDEVLSYPVSDKKIEVVDIPPGYTHSIENLSDGEMIVLFWANQILDQERMDTFFEEVTSDK
jgi:UDP-2-acetamido-2,6-beta-L-arabino-hexul-4-ose reductase